MVAVVSPTSHVSRRLITPAHRRQMQEMRPTTPQELHDWVRIHLNINIPTKRVCTHKDHVAPFEAFCIAEGSLVVTERGEVPIQDLHVGERVLTRKGWKRVQHVTYMGIKDTIRLTFSNGRVLVCTPDHKLAIGDGWKPAGDFRPDDFLFSLVEPNRKTRTSFTSSTSVFKDMDVVSCVGVPVSANGLGTVAVSSGVVAGVSRSARGRDVREVAAVNSFTPMVQGFGRNLSDESFVDGSVQNIGSVEFAPYSAIASGFGSSPDPTGSALKEQSSADVDSFHQPFEGDNVTTTTIEAGSASAGLVLGPEGIPTFTNSHVSLIRSESNYFLPVWDIGVEDCPEFVCQGVVVHNCSAYFGWYPICVWHACLPTGTQVFTEAGPRPIETVEPGTMVWSGTDGQTLSRVVGRTYSGVKDILNIQTRAGELRCTGNHRVWVYREIGWRKFDEGSWVYARDIKPGDHIAQISSTPTEGDESSDFCELAGLLLSDGSVRKHKLQIAHHVEAGYMPHYTALCHRLFGKYLAPDPKNRVSWLYSTKAADFCREKGLGGTAHTKRVPDWVFNLSRERKRDFLRGYLDGDGTVRKDGVEWFSCNKGLMDDLRHLCLSAGIKAGRVRLSKQAGKCIVNGRTVERGDMYSLRAYDLTLVSNDPKYRYNSVKPQKQILSGEGWTGHRVLRIEQEPAEDVWDLEVEGTESFVAEGYVVHNSRGFGGKTFTLAALTLTEAITLGANIKLLGGSGEQSRRVYEYFDGTNPNSVDQFWEAPYAPRHLHPFPSRASTRLTNGAFLSCLAASQTSIRGAHPERLRIDEVDELPLRLFDAAMGQTMSVKRRSVGAQTVISSTWQHPNGTFTEIMKRAKARGWPVYKWCHWENCEPHGWLPQSEIDRKKHETSEQMWEIEYDLCEPIGENRAIDSDSVKWMFDEELGTFKGDCNPFTPIWLEEPSDLVDYYNGTDWAKEQDNTVVVSFRRCGEGQPDRLVGFTRMARAPWPDMQACQERQLRRYFGPSAHDAGGVGNVLHDFASVFSTPIILSGRQRVEIFSAYITAIERKLIKAPRIQWMYEEHLYCLASGTSVTTDRGEVPIEQVKIGDRVPTRQGWKSVYHVTCNGEKPTLRVTLSNGKTLVCTPDHRVATPGGWTKAGQLCKGSQLLALDSLSTDFASLTASPTSVIPSEIVGRVGVSVGAVFNRSTRSSLVDQFGNSLEMTRVAASPVSAEVINLETLRNAAVSKQVSYAVCQHTTPGVWQAASSVTEMIGLGVDPAGEVDLRKLYKGYASEKIVQGPGNSSGAASASTGSVGRSDFALNTVHVVDVSMVGAPQQVWDLGVEDCPEFLAEGVIVHNCDMNQLYGTGHPPDSFVAGALAWYARGGPIALAAAFEPLHNFVRSAIPPQMSPLKLRTEQFTDAEIIKFGQRGYWTNEAEEPPPLLFSLN